jgi:tetratricopeptide (TPR) repeat protein
MRKPSTARRHASAVLAFAVLGIVFAVYWPVRNAPLVWDDKFYLYDRAWLRHGNEWLQVALHGFFDWKVYFRPLGVALFTAETRLFDTAPAPMHLLSLGLHLINILLVGALARKLSAGSNLPVRAGMLACIAMLVYGLHPALIEPVAWISSQCDLLVTLFMLLGLLANMTLRNRYLRSIAVALCFFLAACSKESAVSFPFLLLIMDWLRSAEAPATTRPENALRKLLSRQQPVYLSLLTAGIAYLCVRYWGLGSVLNGNHAAWLSGAHLQTICFIYLAYWKLLIWPMTGLSPLHIVPAQQFTEFGPMSCAIDAAALLIAAAGLFLLYKRKPLGGLITAVTAALLPVLHIIPAAIDESIYHERYAMVAITMACILLPLVIAGPILQHRRKGLIIGCGAAVCVAWLALSVINITVTLPLWSDEVRLWKWALRQNPRSIFAEDALLSTYIERGDVAHAQPLADTLMQDGHACAKCMLNVAFLAIAQHDQERTAAALQEARRSIDLSTSNHALVMGYILASGNLSEMQQDPAGAEEAYNAAIALDPLSPEAHMNLAFLQVRQGKFDDARKSEETALSLSATQARTKRRQQFEDILAASKGTIVPAPR